jgi:hypothetical protein
MMNKEEAKRYVTDYERGSVNFTNFMRGIHGSHTVAFREIGTA